MKKKSAHLQGGYAPKEFLADKRTIKYGDTNTLVIKVGGWPLLPKGDEKPPHAQKALYMTGAPWLKYGPMITDGIWIDFFDELRIKNAKIETDIKTKTANIKLWVDNVPGIDSKVELTAEIHNSKTGESVSRQFTLATFHADHIGFNKALPFSGKGAPLEFSIKCPDAKLWTPETPNLYELAVSIKNFGRFSHSKSFRFGFRNFYVKDGSFYLNDTPIMLRGSNVTAQCIKYGKAALDRENIKKMSIDNARKNNINFYRTHTLPYSDHWQDVFDEEGMLQFCEFPITVNFGNWKFSKEDYNEFHKNAIYETELMLPHYWNRPSIISWVMTNESHMDTEWELGELLDVFEIHDKTRPLNRSCFQTPQMADIHCYDGVWNGGASGFYEKNKAFADKWKNSGKVIVNSEYAGHHWSIKKKIFYPLIGKIPEDSLMKQVYDFMAPIAMEQTEALRLLEFDGILPYAAFFGDYIGRNGKANKKTVIDKAYRNAFEKVMVSVNILDKHFYTKQDLAFSIGAANDNNNDVKTKIIYGISKDNPGYDFSEKYMSNMIDPKKTNLTLKSLRSDSVKVSVHLPDEPGTYYITAFLKSGKKWTMSHREIFVFNVPEFPSTLLNKKITVVSENEIFSKNMQDFGFNNISTMGDLQNTDLVIIAPDLKATPETMSYEKQLKSYIEKGGKMIVLNQYFWHYKNIAPIKVHRLGGRSGVEYAIPSNFSSPIWKDIKQKHLFRMNGLGNGIFQFELLDLPKNSKTLLQGKNYWPDKPQTGMVELKAKKGKIIFNQVRFEKRLKKSSEIFDPVSLQLFINLLEYI